MARALAAVKAAVKAGALAQRIEQALRFSAALLDLPAQALQIQQASAPTSGGLLNLPALALYIEQAA